MKSIRTYLLTRLLGGAALVLAAAGLSVSLVVTRVLEAQFDDNLSNRVQAFVSILFQSEGQVAFEYSDELMPEYVRAEQPAYFEIQFEDGRPLERSKSLRGGNLAVPAAVTRAPAHWTAPLPDGRSGRYVAQLVELHHVYPEEGPNRPKAEVVRVVVAEGREGLVRAEIAVVATGLAGSAALLGLLAVLAWVAVRRGLEPARRMAAALEAIRVERLPRSLGVEDLPEELRSVAETTDDLIRRVDTALERERRTTADIAHELRTPISEVLTEAEVALRDRRDAEGARRALRSIRDVASRMGRSVFTLLQLARIEMGAETVAREAVDLPRLVHEILGSHGSVVRERGLRLELPSDDAGAVEGDREILRIVVSNLLGNALAYAPQGGRIVCALQRLGAGWRLVVENEAPDLRPADLRVLTEPFWRKDSARTDRNRSGLGLALSRALVEKSGMELRFELDGAKLRAVLSRGVEGGSPASNGHVAKDPARGAVTA